MEESMNGGDNNISRLYPSPSNPNALQRAVNRSYPATFVLKLYDMVADQETDSIISWSSTKNSFIIWDPFNFAPLILPKYFTHNNFSSFVSQLNNYGFKKVSWPHSAQCEYANPWFQEGKPEWLKNIKRRNSKVSTSNNHPKEAEEGLSLKRLKTERIGLEVQVEKLRQEQLKLEKELAELQECMRATFAEQEAMLIGLIPDYIQHKVIQRLADQLTTSDDEQANEVHINSQGFNLKEQNQEAIRPEVEEISPPNSSGSSSIHGPKTTFYQEAMALQRWIWVWRTEEDEHISYLQIARTINMPLIQWDPILY